MSVQVAGGRMCLVLTDSLGLAAQVNQDESLQRKGVFAVVVGYEVLEKWWLADRTSVVLAPSAVDGGAEVMEGATERMCDTEVMSMLRRYANPDGVAIEV